MTKPSQPVYELTADERFQYIVTFPPAETKSREDLAIDFLREKFTSAPEYSLRMLRPREYGKIGMAGYRYAIAVRVEEMIDGAVLSYGILMAAKSSEGTR